MKAVRVKTSWALLLALAAVAGCGDGDDSAPPTLDRQLQRSIEAAGISTLDSGPTPPTAKVDLGRALMFDKLLSGNRDISCATCHHPLLHTGDALSLPLGTGARGLGPARVPLTEQGFIPRNAPEAFNRGAPEWRTMFWDMRVAGSADSGFSTPAGDRLPGGLENVLAAQAMFPVTSPEEMRGAPGDHDVFGQPNELAAIDGNDLGAIWDALMQRILAIPEYVAMFNAAFPDVANGELGFQHAANAIAAFEIDAWTFTESPWDRYVAGDRSALSDSAKRGAILFFGDAGCATCHSGNLLTDQKAHNIGVPQIGPGKGTSAPEDYGRELVSHNPADRYAFRTPPLRNVAMTGPWMHDGAFTTLRGAVEHVLDPARSLRQYDVAQLSEELQPTFQGDDATIEAILAGLDPDIATPRLLSEQQVDDLMSFLEALTDPAAGDQSRDIPDSVPSGLPVYD
ncbi:cytochrome-c peroxidase [Candidatus Binatia bacterium]|nr:cytochrome-c peroxidase [Candidatus Binatia bacterium]